MKKSLNLIPFALLVLYYVFVHSNDGLSFLIKIITLAIIILISSFIFLRKIKKDKLNKMTLALLVLFISIAIVSFIYSYSSID